VIILERMSYRLPAGAVDVGTDGAVGVIGTVGESEGFVLADKSGAGMFVTIVDGPVDSGPGSAPWSIGSSAGRARVRRRATGRDIVLQ
jgi:hypothetical protein